MSIPTDPITYAESLIAGVISNAFDSTPYEGEVAIITGMNDAQRTVPCAIVYASEASIPAEIPDWLRNYEVSVAVLILSQAHIPPSPSTEPVKGLEDHREIVSLVMNRLRDTAGIKAAAEAAGHKVYDVQPRAGQPDLEDSKFGTEITLVITVALDLP